MQMEAFLWLFLPVFVAGGSALLSYYIMQARMEVALAKERESLAEARATIVSHKITLEERVRATEESSKRKALDDFMQDIRTEERSYVRESKSLEGSRKTMIMQERLFFRNIPLSNWIEHEMLIEEGRDLNQLPRESVFASAALPAAGTAQLQASQPHAGAAAQIQPVQRTAMPSDTPVVYPSVVSAPAVHQPAVHQQEAPEKRVAITRLLNEVGPQRNAPLNEVGPQRHALLNEAGPLRSDTPHDDGTRPETPLVVEAAPQQNSRPDVPLGPTVLTHHAAAFGAQ